MAVFSIEGWHIVRRTVQMLPEARKIQRRGLVAISGAKKNVQNVQKNVLYAIIISDNHVAQIQDGNKMWTSSCAQFIFICTIYFGSVMSLIQFLYTKHSHSH